MAWLDDEPALLVCFDLSDAGGPGIVDERRTKTAARVARYRAE